MMMTPNERVMTALRGGRADKVPFTVYECMLPSCTTERVLRNRGLCVVYRRPSYRKVMPDVKATSFTTIDENDRKFVRTTYSTPFGDLTELAEVADFTSWTHEYLFKTLDDYKKLMYMIRNVSFIPDYDAAASKIASLGPDFIVRDQIPYEPLQALISRYMGTETFSYEWMDNRDEVLRLYEIGRAHV